MRNEFIDVQTSYLMRRHDLDWLRVMVFGLLIFYQIGRASCRERVCSTV